MSIYVAVRSGSRVYFAADSQTTNGNGMVCHLSDAKFAKFRGGLVVTMPSLAAGDFVRNLSPGADKWTDYPWNLRVWVVNEFVPALRRFLRDNDLLESNPDGAKRLDGTYMFGWRNQLVVIGNDGGTLVPERPFFAHGSGNEVALGVCQTMLEDERHEPDHAAIAAEAVRCAIVLVDSCGGQIRTADTGVA